MPPCDNGTPPVESCSFEDNTSLDRTCTSQEVSFHPITSIRHRRHEKSPEEARRYHHQKRETQAKGAYRVRRGGENGNELTMHCNAEGLHAAHSGKS